MSVRYELPRPTVLAEFPLEPLHAINDALATDGFTEYKGGGYFPWHPGEALKMIEPYRSFYSQDQRDYTNARPAFEALTQNMDKYAQTCLRGLVAVSQKARIYTPEHAVSDTIKNHPSNVTYWDREDYYYGSSAQLVVSDHDSLEILTGTIKGKALPRTWLTRTHEILDYSDEEVTDKLGLSIVAVHAGQLALVPPHSIARRKVKNKPGSTYIELGYDLPIVKKRRSLASKVGRLVYSPKFAD